MLSLFLLLAVIFLAYTNGANDNFKGVATLFGSGTCSYRTAIIWATLTTLAGSLCALWLAGELIDAFSGDAFLPQGAMIGVPFLAAVAFGAGATVLIATLTGMPISTTHGLVGAICGAGYMAFGADLRWAAIGSEFFAPLIASPIMAILLGGGLYLIAHRLRQRGGVGKALCLCVGEREPEVVSLADGTAARRAAILDVSLDDPAICQERYQGRMLGIDVQWLLDRAHFGSAGLVSFARGLNDTPKIAALLLILSWTSLRISLLAVGIAMAIGGLLQARRIAETMGRRITRISHGQGFCANITTALLVIGASKLGLPVSTTHVSVGALFGIGAVTRQANTAVIGKILLSWIFTLPCAGIIAMLIYALLA